MKALDLYTLALLGFGALVLLTAWLPMALKTAPLSLPIVCIAIGAAAAAVPGIREAVPRPENHIDLVMRLTEFLVVISLMGAGLKLDRPLGFRAWRVTWRLLGLAMPLTILGLACAAQWMLGMSVAAALLLAAALAPTDPVLASDIQVGPPDSGEEDEIRFALTSEAGLNDGLAFPFVFAAIAMSATGPDDMPWFGAWLAVDVAWRIAAGVALGYGAGRALAWLLFHMPYRARLSHSGDGFVALGITCVAYGFAELAHGYGFVAVFVAALALRAAERYHEYQRKLHDFAEELERVMMMLLLVGFGAAMTGGSLFGGLTWAGVGFAVLVLFVIRPLSAWLGLAGMGLPAAERGVISFYGIRGIGAMYYLTYALEAGTFAEPAQLWSTLAFTVLLSIILHGTTVTPVMRWLDQKSRAGG
jgi:sodium/hydrogen antiporter